MLVGKCYQVTCSMQGCHEPSICKNTQYVSAKCEKGRYVCTESPRCAGHSSRERVRDADRVFALKESLLVEGERKPTVSMLIPMIGSILFCSLEQALGYSEVGKIKISSLSGLDESLSCLEWMLQRTQVLQKKAAVALVTSSPMCVPRPNQMLKLTLRDGAVYSELSRDTQGQLSDITQLLLLSHLDLTK